MNPINAQDLKPGMMVFDADIKDPVKMEFISIERNIIKFKYISGPKCYTFPNDNIIWFPVSSNIPFYTE